MSDTKLDPASLTAEERAIVEDAVSHHAFFDADGNIVECDEWTWCYRSAIARILARRALFAPAKEEAKVLPCGCVRCTCENETQCQGCGAKNCAEHRASRTAPPSEMPPQDEVKAVAHNVRECGSDEAAALILALSLVKWRSQPEPTPPSEMPGSIQPLLELAKDRYNIMLCSGVSGLNTATAWRLAIEAAERFVSKMQQKADENAPPSEMPIDRARQIAAQCWCDPETESIEMDARLAEAFARRLVEFRRPQPAPALRMTPELEMVLGFAAETTKMRDDDESWMEEHLDKMQGIIAAVRAQASQPQGVAEDSDRTTYLEELAREESMYCAVLPKVREALIALSGCVNDRVNMDKVIAALAELDAAEWKVTG